MKRFHVHVAVADLAQSTRFYSAMFGVPPTVQKVDYAKWMLDDPRVNFAISSRGNSEGVNHLGFQADDANELAEIHTRLQNADSAIVAEEAASCCYAKSDKYWVTDPSGIAWESFHTLDSIPTFSGSAEKAEQPIQTGCCPKPIAIAAETMKSNTSINATKGACCG